MNKYIIIDVMAGEYYFYQNDIEMGFSLDSVLKHKERVGIPYQIYQYNNGKVVVIRQKNQ